MDTELKTRSNDACELCGAHEGLEAFGVEPSENKLERTIVICPTCKAMIENPSTIDEGHFRAVSDTMWSEVLGVQVMSYRLLVALQKQELVDMLYFEDEVKAYADAIKLESTNESSGDVCKDSNGTPLNEGDSITLIKDLEVKGAGFTAKRGTLVKNIRLTNDPKTIEGKINGTTIVLVAAYMKKV